MDISENVSCVLSEECFFDIDGEDAVECEYGHKQTVKFQVDQYI